MTAISGRALDMCASDSKRQLLTANRSRLEFVGRKPGPAESDLPDEVDFGVFGR